MTTRIGLPVTLALVFALAGSAGAGGINFPNARVSVSPDFKWIARCVTTKQGDGYLHAVLLGPFGKSEATRIWGCDRSCDILWPDDSQRLAITDWTGSSLSEICVVDVSKPDPKRLDVLGIETLIPRDELQGHCYYEALRWENRRRLLIRVFGHTDENPSHGFAYYLSVDTANGAGKLIRQSDAEDG